MRHRSFDEISSMCAMMMPQIWRISYHWIHTSWICVQNRWHKISHDEIDQWKIQSRNDTQSKTTHYYYYFLYIYIYIYNTYDEDSILWNISLKYYARYRIDKSRISWRSTRAPTISLWRLLPRGGVLNERPAEGAPHRPEWARFRDALQPISRPQDGCPEHHDRRWLPWTSTSPRKSWFPNRILTPLGSARWGRTLKVANAFLRFTNDDTIRVGLLTSNIESRERVFSIYQWWHH